jgi:hypothetical protein
MGVKAEFVIRSCERWGRVDPDYYVLLSRFEAYQANGYCAVAKRNQVMRIGIGQDMLAIGM